MNARALWGEIAAIVTDPDIYTHPWEVLTALFRVITGDVCDDTVCTWPTGLSRSERQQRELQILAIARNTAGTVNQEMLREFLPFLSQETVRLSLADLCQRGLLIKIGDKRGARYKRSEQRG